jgi:hypothetical protein
VSAINVRLIKYDTRQSDHIEKVGSTVFERRKRTRDNFKVSWNKVEIKGVVADRHVHWTAKAVREEA